MSKVRTVSDAQFEAEVLGSETMVLVDFWAPWCGPCKSIAPVLEEIANELDGQIIIMKMNVDENPQTPTQYNVRGIPNLVLFKGGEMVDQVVGAVPKEQLMETIQKHIKNAA